MRGVMAKFNPPKNFSFDESGEQPDWKQRSVRFRPAAQPDGRWHRAGDQPDEHLLIIRIY